MSIPANKLLDVRYLLALGFGSGLARRAPGTFGTFAAVLPFLLMQHLPPLFYVGIVFVSFVAGVLICDWVANDMAIKDPAAIVWDEFVGLWVALFMLPEGWWWIVVGVAIFRFFDIVKPWPVSVLDRSVGGGLGIMADDVAAGVYTLIMVQTIAWALAQY